jgi:hypothetical protein
VIELRSGGNLAATPRQRSNFEKQISKRIVRDPIFRIRDVWNWFLPPVSRELLESRGFTAENVENAFAPLFADLQQSLLTEDVDDDHRVQILGIAAEMYVKLGVSTEADRCYAAAVAISDRKPDRASI